MAKKANSNKTQTTTKEQNTEIQTMTIGEDLINFAARTAGTARQAQEQKIASDKLIRQANKRANKSKARGDGEPCECGCGGQPARKSSRFLPGHDSRMRSALTGPREISDCLCGCGSKPASARSRYLPGHDAKHLSQMTAKIRWDDGEAQRTQREVEAAAQEAAEEVTVS